MENKIVISNNIIQDLIYDIRGMKVMLDYDLASIYGVETRTLNQAVKRNIDRFPEDFMFRLSSSEWEILTHNLLIDNMPSQFVIASIDRRNKSLPPYAFTEHGAVMLASVLRSPSAIQMSVAVTRAFIAMRQAISAMLSYDLKIEQLSHKVDQLNAHVDEIMHDQNDINNQQELINSELAVQIETINEALEQLMEKKDAPSNPIGFRLKK
jgi:outer membrane murein-binding lipoprotein Lpp